MNLMVKRLSMAAIGTLISVSMASAQSELEKVMKERGLTQQDLLAAAKTYTPSGGRDKYIVFSSGGQSGQMLVYGVPSMRILKYIGVFTPEPWQGYGFDDESKAVLAQGRIEGRTSSMVTLTIPLSPKPTATMTPNTSSSTTRPILALR